MSDPPGIEETRTVTFGGHARAGNGNPVVEPPAPAPADSILERVRSIGNAQRAALHVDLPLRFPPWDGRLVLVYRAVPIDQAERFAMLGDRVSDVEQSLNLMVDACSMVKWVEHDVCTELGLRLDWRLWQFMGWELPPGTAVEQVTPREVVTKLFDDNALVLGAHLTELTDWMSNPGGGVRSPGESQAATS